MIKGYDDIKEEDMFFKYDKELVKIPLTDRMLHQYMGFALLCGFPIKMAEKED